MAELIMVERACPICGSANQSRVVAEADFDSEALDAYAFASRKIPEYMHYRLLLCNECDLLYSNPIPSLSQIAEAYHEAAFDSGVEARCAAQTYRATLAKIALKDRDGALDIGTGDGAFLEELLAMGFQNVVGVEPSAAPIAAARESVRPLIRHGLFRKEDFNAEQFRLISCFQTIEHLYDPMEVCSAAMELLKPDGVLFLVCHNRRGFVNRALRMKSPIYDIEHLQLFSPRSAVRLLERAGYSDVSARSIRNRYPLAYWMRLFPLPLPIKKRLLALLAKTGIGAWNLSLPVGNLASTDTNDNPLSARLGVPRRAGSFTGKVISIH